MHFPVFMNEWSKKERSEKVRKDAKKRDIKHIFWERRKKGRKTWNKGFGFFERKESWKKLWLFLFAHLVFIKQKIFKGRISPFFLRIFCAFEICLWNGKISFCPKSYSNEIFRKSISIVSIYLLLHLPYL